MNVWHEIKLFQLLKHKLLVIYLMISIFHINKYTEMSLLQTIFYSKTSIMYILWKVTDVLYY